MNRLLFVPAFVYQMHGGTHKARRGCWIPSNCSCNLLCKCWEQKSGPLNHLSKSSRLDLLFRTVGSAHLMSAWFWITSTHPNIGWQGTVRHITSVISVLERSQRIQPNWWGSDSERPYLTNTKTLFQKTKNKKSLASMYSHTSKWP